MDILQSGVSIYPNCHTNTGATSSMIDFLLDDAYNSKVKAARKKPEKLDALKQALPAITVSGIFQPRRAVDNIKKHSGALCIDIDRKDNMHIQNFEDFKLLMSTAPFVAFCSLSVSGKGYFVIIPIAYPHKHKEHFLAIELLFRKLGIVIDPSGKDVTRLRIKSYDPDPYINHNAETFNVILESVRRINLTKPAQDLEKSMLWVETAIEQIVLREIDLTPTYEKWLQIAFAFATEFDEEGRKYFHQISQFHPNYSFEQCDDQYDKCLRGDHSKGISIASFYDLCSKADINIKNLIDFNE